MASISLGAKTTTSISAACTGPIYGPLQAKCSEFRLLHFIKDSVLVINQLRGNRSPFKPHLAALYRTARALADDVSVASWAQHIREYTRMADLAASIAMNTKATLQVHAQTNRSIVLDITRHIQHDFNHWLETSARPDRGGSTTRNLQNVRESALTAQQMMAI